MAFHHQAALPATWVIADQANLPSGRTLAGTAARVYNLLVQTAHRAYRWQVGRHLAPSGWVPTWVLREPWAGGAAGDRRLRDLREDGLPIESQRFQPEHTAPASATWLWRLAGPGREGGGPTGCVPLAQPNGLGRGDEKHSDAAPPTPNPPFSPLPGRACGVAGEGPGVRAPGGGKARIAANAAARIAARIAPHATPHAPAAPAAGGRAAPLTGLTITLTATRPTHPPIHPGAVEISPGALSPLAPPLTILDDDAYRADLRHRYHTGQLAAALAGRHDWTLWTDPDAPYDPRPVLAGVLTALGATVTGAAHLGA
jgi:hypothetical protein